MTEPRRQTPSEVAVWASLNPRDRFQLVFGQDVTATQPNQIFSVIHQRFDAFNLFRKGRYEFGATKDRHDAALARVGARTYRDFERKGTEALDALSRSLEAAKPFVEEDLGFIGELASDEGSYADFQMMVEMWETSKQGGESSLTEHQKQILQGHITLKPQK